MAKKSKRINKDVRRLMEGISDLVKKNKSGNRYKFKSKNKKVVKKVKKTCIHWIVRKGNAIPTVDHDPNNSRNWKCLVCGASFPIMPLNADGKSTGYDAAVEQMLGLVNQMQFWSVKLGGDADDTKMFLKLKENLPRFAKVSRQIIKRVNKREEYESNRAKGDVMAQFDAYSGFGFKQ